MELKRLRVDIVSDVMCPWCLIGWLKFQQVIQHYAGQLTFDVHWRPFELNPDMPAGGVNAAQYLAERYGISPEQGRANRGRMKETAESLGFSLDMSGDFRMRNSFNAHRLLTWAAAVDDADGGLQDGRGGRQTALKMALFRAHFSDGADVNNPDDLIAACVTAGLDAEIAAKILASDQYSEFVRTDAAQWQDRGVSGVPAFILDGRMMIPGAQEPEVFIRVIDRKILSQAD